MHKIKWRLVLGLGAVVLLVVTIALAHRAYRREYDQRSVVTTYGAEPTTGGIDAYVTIVDVDPVHQEARARVALRPVGDLSDDQQNPVQALNIYCNTLTGPQDHLYRAGKSMSPLSMTVNLYDGMAADYPFDKFDAEIEIQASRVDPSHPRKILVPMQVHLSAEVSGIKMTPLTADTVPGYVDVHLSVTRSDTVVGTAVCGMLVMWAIGIAVLSLTLSILITNEHLNTLTFLSGLLFALFSFRDSLPGTPPVGTFSDYISFFWVEGIVSLSLVTVVGLNIVQRIPKKNLGGGGTDADSDG